MEENVVDVLLGLSVSETALAQENGLGCLCNMMVDDEDDKLDETSINMKLWIVREKVIECMNDY